jgi:hypothetical protein
MWIRGQLTFADGDSYIQRGDADSTLGIGDVDACCGTGEVAPSGAVAAAATPAAGGTLTALGGVEIGGEVTVAPLLSRGVDSDLSPNGHQRNRDSAALADLQ